MAYCSLLLLCIDYIAGYLFKYFDITMDSFSRAIRIRKNNSRTGRQSKFLDWFFLGVQTLITNLINNRTTIMAMDGDSGPKQDDKDPGPDTISREYKILNVKFIDNNNVDYKTLEELKDYAEKKGILLVSSDEKVKNHTEYERNKYKTLEEFKKLKSEQPAEKKVLAIKEISRVLTDIEETKKIKRLIYFSNLQRKRIVDSTGKAVGKLKDLVISGGEKFPEVSHILIIHNDENILISWQDVQSFDGMIRLSKPYEKEDKRFLKDDDICLGENILDQQVVDVNGLKVIRVNDIALTFIKNKLAVVNIDVGTRAFVRRLGFERLFDALNIDVKDHPVPWNTIEPLVGSIEKIHLKVPCPRVSDLHPADVAELFDELGMLERSTILKSMKSERAAQVMLECEPEVQASIIKSLKPKRLATIFEKMSPNDIANMVNDENNDQITLALNFMNKDIAVHVQEMLAYKEGSVARYMEESFITISPDLTVGTATDYVRSLSKYPTDFYYIYVVDENEVLIGVMSLKHLVVADANAIIRDIMKSKVISVDLNSPIEYVEELLTKYDLMSLPVIDINGKMRGIINIDDVLDIVMERAKHKESFELTEEQREDLGKKSRFRNYYSALVKDTNQFLKELDSIKPKKKDYLMESKDIFNRK